MIRPDGVASPMPGRPKFSELRLLWALGGSEEVGLAGVRGYGRATLSRVQV